MAISLVWGSVPPVPAHELRGFAVGEGRLFTASGLHPGQKDVSVAAAIKPEYFHRFPD
ncbi:MAG: hypothetical protein GWM98_25500, partial [Nitrospinaceae bacterium]|nr:hypothetical protein [Nitrospinaceae bacterium]NIT84524.1 hypothetical protein [Nitrospinaceae bacterium]NIW61462.1 hypothetical protein [Nitrospinaceae bacterium]NIX36871.1 hypothetical protein [Nitrospinaceae bacterium]NIY17984.1 hypothetical protein [Nitrospinaceae bacterium]